MPPASLLHAVVHPDNLRQAWNEVAENRGMAGVDHIRIEEWRRNWEGRLNELARAVLANTYKPTKLRLRRIPKKKRGQFRTLRIPTVTDRVLQRAVHQVLEPLYEPAFMDCSFGYRPGRSLKMAVQRILDFREAGYTRVLDADIDDFFNQVDHELLFTFLQEDLPDDSLLGLIRGWLGISFPGPHTRGIPMGSPLSPILANIYLHRLDWAVSRRSFPLVRYADDFIVLCESDERANAAYEWVDICLDALQLRYKPEKTCLTTFAEGFHFLGVQFTEDGYSFHYGDKEIEVDGDFVNWLFSQYGPEYE